MAATAVVVLGGTGFLGRHVCAAFAAAGADVAAVSRSAGPAPGGVRHHPLDLLAADTAELARLCTGADTVVNAAGAVWGGTEQQMADANTHLVERLVRALADLPGRRPRLVQLGSAYEYGPAEPGAVTDEDHPPAPNTPYGRTKLAGTRAVLRAADERDLDAVVLRISVACGPGAPPNSLPGIVAAHLAAGRTELRLAPLRAHRDLVDVRDVADAAVAAARADVSATGRVINVGSGRAVPVRDLVDLLIELGGRPLRIVEERAAQGTRSDAPWLRLDVSRARRLLDWTPHRSLPESLADFLKEGSS